MRQLLIGAQVAASCVLLIVAALLARALDRVMSADPGFEYQHVISIRPGLASHGYSSARAGAYLDRLEAGLRLASALDPEVFPEVRLLKASFRSKPRETELSALGVSVLGFSALLLACVGIVGLVAYSVAHRTKEIGIRLVAGTLAAAALSQLLRRQLYGISHLDPAAYIAAVGVFVVTVGIAALWPARRALVVDPLLALRND